MQISVSKPQVPTDILQNLFLAGDGRFWIFECVVGEMGEVKESLGLLEPLGCRLIVVIQFFNDGRPFQCQIFLFGGKQFFVYIARNMKVEQCVEFLVDQFQVPLPHLTCFEMVVCLLAVMEPNKLFTELPDARVDLDGLDPLLDLSIDF